MTNNNNNYYSWTKDFSTAVLLWEQGIAPGPPAGTTLGGQGGDSVTPAPHHCTPISSITPGTPSAVSGSGGAGGEGGGGGKHPCPAHGRGAGGAPASHLSPRQPLRSELDRRHTQTPMGVTEGGAAPLYRRTRRTATHRQTAARARGPRGEPCAPRAEWGLPVQGGLREGSLLWVLLLLLLWFLFIFLPTRVL